MIHHEPRKWLLWPILKMASLTHSEISLWRSKWATQIFLASYNDHMNDSYSERLEFSFWSVTTIYPTNKKAYSAATIPFLRDILFSKILFFPFELIPSLIHCNFQVSTIPNVADSQGQNHSEIIPYISSAVNNEHLLYVYIRRKVHSLGI